MKKFLSVISVILLLAVFSGCGEYSSSYKAVGFVHSNDSDSAYMTFHSFEGKMVFRLKCREPGSKIRYSGKLESGSVSVSCECGGEKRELFSLSPGDDISSEEGELSEGTVYVIVLTEGKALNGDIRFEIV